MKEEKKGLAQQENRRLYFILCLLKDITESYSNLSTKELEKDLKGVKCNTHKEIKYLNRKIFYLNKISSNLKILSNKHYFKYKSLISSLKKNIADVI